MAFFTLVFITIVSFINNLFLEQNLYFIFELSVFTFSGALKFVNYLSIYLCNIYKTQLRYSSFGTHKNFLFIKKTVSYSTNSCHKPELFAIFCKISPLYILRRALLPYRCKRQPTVRVMASLWEYESSL